MKHGHLVLSGLACVLSLAAVALALTGPSPGPPPPPLHERAPTLLDATIDRLEADVARLEQRLAESGGATPGAPAAPAGEGPAPAPAELANLLQRLGALELEVGGLARARAVEVAPDEPLVLDARDREVLGRFQAQLADRSLSWRVRYETVETLAAYPEDADAFAGPVLDQALAFAEEIGSTEFRDNVYRQLGHAGLRGDPRLAARLPDILARVQAPNVREELVELCAGAQDDPRIRRLLEDIAASSTESAKVRRIARQVLDGRRR
ncbi:MAG: hypothetical protein R3F30_15745 [Planctomycetota bacterium]